MAGAVYAAGQRIDKPDRRVDPLADVEVRASIPYVGFGGIKLEQAIEEFGIDVKGKLAVDIGSSTGGFVDCLLQKGARRVYAVDVGRHQIHDRLRRDPRVVLMEETNARYLMRETIPEKADVVTVDVSFISLKKVLPALVPLLDAKGVMITLFKPQFEVGRPDVGRGGIVRDDEKTALAIEELKAFGETLGLRALRTAEAPREREKKNREYFILWAR